MRTLYVRIVVMTMFIMVVSALIAFVVSNLYYQGYLKPENDKKITSIAQDIVAVYEESTDQSITNYLDSMTNLGYQFYLIDQNGNESSFGEPFRVYNLKQNTIENVLNGDLYHGIANFPWRPFITGFFNNELSNTVGVPITINGEVKALFVRPDTAQQFGEMRIFLTILLIFILLFSFILVIISTSFIVNPIKRLTEATKKIAAGNYHVQLKNDRYDEIGRLARDFTKMSNQLKLIEDKRQEFVSSVSHEIQSPLTSIQGFSHALRKQNLSVQDRDHYLSIIEDESRRLSELSEQLLILSFLDSELDVEQKTSFNLIDQLKEVISSMKWQRLEKDVAIELDAEPVVIFGHQKLLHQAWINLLKNAIRYNFDGGTVYIQVINNHDNIDVLFKDTGIGMSSEDVSQIFHRFYKADKARTRTEKSTGLGLSIVKKVIELHHGTIMVDSKLGKGSTFKITLPIE